MDDKSPCRTNGFPLPRPLRADQKRTKYMDQKTTHVKVKGLFVSSSRSAKPLYVGSNPTRASKLFNNNGLGWAARLKLLLFLLPGGPKADRQIQSFQSGQGCHCLRQTSPL